MPPFCIGTAATGVGDYGTQSGPLNVRGRHRQRPAPQRFSDADVDVAISAAHGGRPRHGAAAAGAVRRRRRGSGDPDLHQLRGHPAGTHPTGACARYCRRGIPGDTGQTGAGGRLRRSVTRPAGADAGHRTAGRPGPHRARRPDEPGTARRAADGGDGSRARIRPRRQDSLQPLNPDWDHAFLELLDTNRLADIDGMGRTAGSPGRPATPRTKSAPGWRPSPRWPPQGPYETQQRYYRPAPELIAGFAIRTAVPA